MTSRDLTHASDVLAAAGLVNQFAADLGGVEDLRANLLTQSAIMRQLEIMGEATKRLSTAFRDAHPNVPWRRIAGLRDVLIHSYDELDLDKVWETVVRDVPAIIPELETIIASGSA